MLFTSNVSTIMNTVPWRVLHLAMVLAPGTLKSTSLLWPPRLLPPLLLMSSRSTGKLAMQRRTSERPQVLSSSFEVKPSRMPSAPCNDFIAIWAIQHLQRWLNCLRQEELQMRFCRLPRHTAASPVQSTRSLRAQAAPAAMPKNTQFNEALQADVMWLRRGSQKYAVMSSVDSATRYTAAVLINSEHTDNYIKALERAWIAHYGAPGSLLTDEGRGWLSTQMGEWTSAHNIKHIVSPGEAHERLAPVEPVLHRPSAEQYSRCRWVLTCPMVPGLPAQSCWRSSFRFDSASSLRRQLDLRGDVVHKACCSQSPE